MKINRTIISCLLMLTMIFSLSANTNVSAASNEVSPKEGHIYYASPEFFLADLTGYEKAVFELEGVRLGTSDNSGKLELSEAIPFGSHTLKTIKIASDGSSACDETNFEICATSVENEQKGGSFDYLGEGTIEGVANYNIDLQSKAELTRVTGKNGNDGDYALSMLVTPGNQCTNKSKIYLEPSNFKNYNEGVSEVSFDIKLNTIDTEFIIRNYAIGDSTNFTNAGGYWSGTDIAIVPGKWVNLKFFIDADNNKYIIYIDGKKELSGNMVDGMTYNNFRIEVNKSAVATQDHRPGIIIDNFSAIDKKVYSGITKLSYINGGTEVNSASGIPSDASLKVYFADDGLADNDKINTQNISLKTLGGVNIPLEAVSYDAGEKAVTIVPASALPQGETVKLTFNENISFEDNVSLGGEHCVYGSVAEKINTAVVFKKATDVLHTYEQIKNGDVISAEITVTNTSPDDVEKLVYILSERKDGRLVSMVSKTIENLSAGQSAGTFVLTLPLASEGEGSEIKLMVWNGFENANAAGKINKLN